MAKLLLNIDVPDMDQAVAFYTAALDLRVGREFDSAFVELLGAEAPIYLLQKQPGTAADPANNAMRDYGRHWTPIHPDFVVEDMEAAIGRVVKAGAVQEGETTDTPYGKLAMFADPVGHGFCLIEFNDAGYEALVEG